MPQNVQLSDEANAILDEYIIEADRLKEKGKTASDAVVTFLMPELSDLRQQLVIEKFPKLAFLRKRKSKKDRK